MEEGKRRGEKREEREDSGGIENWEKGTKGEKDGEKEEVWERGLKG